MERKHGISREDLSLYNKTLETGKGLEVKLKLNLRFPESGEHSTAMLDFGDGGQGVPGDLVLEIVISKYIFLSTLQNFLGVNTTLAQ